MLLVIGTVEQRLQPIAKSTALAKACILLESSLVDGVRVPAGFSRDQTQFPRSKRSPHELVRLSQVGQEVVEVRGEDHWPVDR